MTLTFRLVTLQVLVVLLILLQRSLRSAFNDLENGFEHYYVFDQSHTLREVACVYEPTSGRKNGCKNHRARHLVLYWVLPQMLSNAQRTCGLVNLGRYVWKHPSIQMVQIYPVRLAV